MFYLRYTGQFLSRDNTAWRTDILQEADAEFPTVGLLQYPSDSPLIIEWERKSKEEPLCGSTATLTIVSPGDRTYQDLYIVQVGKIRLDVYGAGQLYWSGTIDPEFYEEPYSTLLNYDVTLTFSDFGILNRLKYDLTGMQTLEQVLGHCLNRSLLNCQGINRQFISTRLPGADTPLQPADIMVRSDNFYDEDGEPQTLSNVLQSLLQPLALRMVQRNGRIVVYDLNALYHNANVSPIDWQADNQKMGTDVVYSNAKITWSTYTQEGNLLPQECWPQEPDPALTALNRVEGKTLDNATYYSYHYSTDLADWIDATDSGFTLWTGTQGEGLDYLHPDARYFRIVPQNDASDSQGIAIYWKSVEGLKETYPGGWSAAMKEAGHGISPHSLKGTLAAAGTPLLRTLPVWLPPVDEPHRLRLQVGLELLMDPRFNPYEQAANLMDGVKQKDMWSQWQTRGIFIYVPVIIKFCPHDTDTEYCWTNQLTVATDVKYPMKTLNDTCGRWVECTGMSSDAPNAWGYLAYYNVEDRKEHSGVLGWQKNRPAINPHVKKLSTSLAQAGTGQNIPYPDFGRRGGTLQIEVLHNGWMLSDGGRNLSDNKVMDPYNLWGKLSWMMMKMPEVEIKNNVQFAEDIDTCDVEYSATINPHAKDDIEIDTLCGTSAQGAETARGAYFASGTGRMIRTLTRAGRTTQAEELLIGTLYSQFAHRKTKLSGTLRALTHDLCLYSDPCQPGKRFICLSDAQNLIAAESEAEIVELRPDEYKNENES